MSQSTEPEPAVTVMMPLLRTGQYSESAIDSILNQTFSDLELLIICDEPDPSLLRTLEVYSNRDSRVRIQVNRRRIGVVAARNQALRLSRGRYLSPMDSDDISHPERLERQVAFLERHPEIGLLATGIEYINDQGERIRKVEPIITPKALKWTLFFENPLCQSSVLMRRTVLDAVGWYDESRPLAEDYDLWIRISSVTGIQMLPDILLKYRVHESNLSSRQREALDRGSSVSNARLLRMYFPEMTEDDTDAFEHLFLRRDLPAGSDALRVGGMIESMYGEFVRREQPLKNEVVEIRRHLGLQYLILAYLAKRADPLQALNLFLWGCRYRRSLPLEFLRLVMRKARE